MRLHSQRGTASELRRSCPRLRRPLNPTTKAKSWLLAADRVHCFGEALPQPSVVCFDSSLQSGQPVSNPEVEKLSASKSYAGKWG
jgi:hypothetical protein